MRYNKHRRSGALYFYENKRTIGWINVETETGEGYAELSSVSVSFFKEKFGYDI